MLVPITLGEIIYCEKCDNIKTVRYRTEALIKPPMIGYCERYREHTGICQDCVKKNHYKIVFENNLSLIQTYKYQFQSYRRFVGMVQTELHKLKEKVTPEFLEQLNPEVAERYRSNAGRTDLDAAKQYIAEIKTNLVAYITDTVNKRIASSRKFSNQDEYKKTEVQIQRLLAECEGYATYCLPYQPFRSRNILFPLFKHGSQFKRLCKGRPHTNDSFYQRINFQPKEIQTLMNDFGAFRAKSKVDMKRTFDKLINCLPARIVEEKFWQ